ncbi:hypothetical protein Asi03nite_71740 [Actinoplanes siamensis]|uniref:Transposase n=1 Tax=Actinoplanes siamensis TaxID=1223317 RepID=A0A919TNL2_9ACTN|nr:hypothetical protein Asi03nite_71740 [Actinoplanes siamensis]
MRSDRVLRRPTPPRVYNPEGGRPAKHGGEFVFGNPATWDAEQAVTHTDTRLYGQVRAQAWDRLHPRLTRRAAWVDHDGPLPIIEGTVIRLTVEHLPSRGEPKPLWLWWSKLDATDADVDRCWQAFLRRFDIEHTFRLLKQTLGWTVPQLREPAAADRWTWLVIAAHTQLRLARPLAQDLRRPWDARWHRSGSPRPGCDEGFGTSARPAAHQRVRLNPAALAPDGHPAPAIGSPLPVTKSDLSWSPARLTSGRPITRRAPSPAELVKRQAQPCHGTVTALCR